MHRKRMVGIIGGVVVLAMAITWYLFRPELLFINRTVSEKFPASGKEATSASSAPTVLSRGSFHGLAHETKGVATIYELPDGKRALRLTEFETSNGPDVRVYLVAALEAKDNETVRRAGFVDLGAMKGNIGDQNYEVGADIDLGKYRSVSIWCHRFGVNFGAASLAPARG
ncbi:MAG: DM13 domain-containing protein [Deltaproteobacteria bacterium]|nr:DM13 domain-containing protein [Deltaproteobacteria bacterium]